MFGIVADIAGIMLRNEEVMREYMDRGSQVGNRLCKANRSYRDPCWTLRDMLVVLNREDY